MSIPVEKKEKFLEKLRIPVISAPMFLVSGPKMVVEACNAGVVGSFPSLNARTQSEFRSWLTYINSGIPIGNPYAVNLILHRSNSRLEEDLKVVEEFKVPVVITSVGRPARVVDLVHSYGGLVLSDVATIHHARKAAKDHVDGLVLLTAGAGGNTGWINPFPFIKEVRSFYSGIVAVAGSITDGRQLRAIQLLGADIGYIGTAFMASFESLAPSEHKQAIIDSDADDIVNTDVISGLPASFIRSRLIESGVMSKDGVFKKNLDPEIFSYKNVWSAGQGIGSIRSIDSVKNIVDRIESEFLQS